MTEAVKSESPLPTSSSSADTPVQALGHGAATAVALGYATVSCIFAVAMCKAGLPPWLPVAMCVFVYAGASQFAALSLLASGASLSLIVMSTLTINLRHLLMSVYLSQKLGKLKPTRLQLWLYGYGLTDESFAVHSEWLRTNRVNSMRPLITFNTVCHAAWILGAVVGAISAASLGVGLGSRLDYALTAMMLFVLASLCRSRLSLLAAAIAISAALGLKHFASTVVHPTAALFISTLISCLIVSWMKRFASR